jgi:hypothetical protein
LWSTSQLFPWSGVFTWRSELSLRCLLSKVISFIISTLYIKHCHLIIPLFVAICEIWVPGLTYGVYLILFLKPGATQGDLALVGKTQLLESQHVACSGEGGKGCIWRCCPLCWRSGDCWAP